MRSGSTGIFVGYWSIGFTGHRKVAEPDKIASVIAAELQNLRSHVVGSLIGISSVASGADTLFAKEVLKAGCQWFAMLPFPREEFEKDFGADEWKEALECLERATLEEVWALQADRPNAYADVGIDMVERSDILMAVWDGAASRGAGGTAEIVEYARENRKPLVWIHASTGIVSYEHWPEGHFEDRAFDALHRLPCGKSIPTDGPPLDRLFLRLDDAARTTIPSMRFQEIRVVVYNSIATTIALAALALHWMAFDLVTLNFQFVLAGFVAACFLHFRKAGGKYVEARLIAEICRSLIATRGFPERLNSPYRFSVPRLKHTLRCIMIMRDIEKSQGHLQPSHADLMKFRDEYLRLRIQDQLGYYRKHRTRSAPRVVLYARMAFFASMLAVAATFVGECIGWRFVDHWGFPFMARWILHPGQFPAGVIAAPDSKLISLIGIVAPSLVAIVTSILSVNEHRRRDGRYREMEQLLTAAERRLSHVVTLCAIKQVVVDTESALLAENFEWYYQAVGSEGH